MSLTSIILAAALAGLLGGGVAGWKTHAWKTDAAVLAAEKKADAKEAEWQLIYKETNDAKESALRDVASERDAALLSLRNRPQRLPSAALTACAGSTGRELSERDAAAFTGLAARADTIRAELEACYKREAVN